MKRGGASCRMFRNIENAEGGGNIEKIRRRYPRKTTKTIIIGQIVNKATQHPEYLRQAALEVVESILERGTLIYTDGSKNQEYTGSGPFTKFGKCGNIA
ncbi:hypothetical protein TNCV_4279011 [Trichonephila clavipes]|nr:hypothetical protein TNCV_4279011 [Trichonephila clavipes]